eukprot:SAG11_NODE_31841_length_288_cov_1.634921_1_plen_88_part_01
MRHHVLLNAVRPPVDSAEYIYFGAVLKVYKQQISTRELPVVCIHWSARDCVVTRACLGAITSQTSNFDQFKQVRSRRTVASNLLPLEL